MNKKIVIGILITIIISTFSYGVLVGSNKIFPYELIITTKKIIYPDNDILLETNQKTPQIDVESIIHISDLNDITNIRNSLINYIWKEEGFPHSKMPQIQNNISDPKYDDLLNLKQINKITITMEYEVNSIVYLFEPEQSNNILVIYHYGHGDDFFKDKDTIQYFLKKGYSVMAFTMPLQGLNSQPVLELSRIGTIKLISHNQFILLESPQFSPIKFFVEPIAASLNYVDKNFDFNSYYMVGISGGGWTTILYSAIDERISQSYSVAGSYPFYLRQEQKDVGDYEQMVPELYNIANYLDLYILGSYGENRKLVQIFNKFDPCCFSGDGSLTYEDMIKSRLLKLQKGHFEVYIDDTHREHKISAHALNIISNLMKQ